MVCTRKTKNINNPVPFGLVNGKLMNNRYLQTTKLGSKHRNSKRIKTTTAKLRGRRVEKALGTESTEMEFGSLENEQK